MKLITLSGPRGAGKGAVGDELLKGFFANRRIVPCTTRQPRPGERDGIDYHFLSLTEFHQQVSDGRFAFYQQISGSQWSGTRWSELWGCSPALVDVTPQGARVFREKLRAGETFLIFIHAPFERRLERATRCHPSLTLECASQLLAEDPVDPDPRRYADFDLVVENHEGKLADTVSCIMKSLAGFVPVLRF